MDDCIAVRNPFFILGRAIAVLGKGASSFFFILHADGIIIGSW